ncbi:enoyl-CoA hydratase/isomerase family protein [Microbacterium sp. X-17]|uniref:enoyl-CoA hydratase/isomerase family protein n=1 Tax=Microbacterium sp. X-17 TaxID=3144404 RepID=UPI0031F53F6E
MRCSLAELMELSVDGRAPWRSVDRIRHDALVVVDLDHRIDLDWDAEPQRRVLEHLTAPGPVLVGVTDRAVPDTAAPLLDRLTYTLAPQGPGRMWVDEDPANGVAAIEDAVARAPVAAATLAGLLRITAAGPVAEALLAESFAYSMLLAGPEFQAWRTITPRRPVPEVPDPVLVERDGGTLSVTLNVPARRNALGNAVRARLLEALELAAADRSVSHVVLRGAGPSFCSGGDLDEFGTFDDVATAHAIRTLNSPGYALHRIADRTEVRVHGAVIGAGIEVAAFASRIVAAEDAWFRLPEVSMGLVPGAGGTVSIPRRIGRHRTAWMALTGESVSLDRALAWGLADDRA